MKTWKNIFSEFLDSPTDVLHRAVNAKSFGHEEEEEPDAYQSFFGWGVVVLVLFILMTAWVVSQIVRLGGCGGGDEKLKMASRFTAAGVAFCVFPVFGYIPALFLFIVAEVYFYQASEVSSVADPKRMFGRPQFLI